jgi:hypothetical protein
MGVGQTITLHVPTGPPPTTVPVSPATTTTLAVGAVSSSTSMAPGSTSPVTGTLPRTGAPMLPILLWVAIALLIAGRLFVGVARRLARDGQEMDGR